jgi:hypothetical protein
MLDATDEICASQHGDEPNLAGFLMTWSNESDPDIYQQALKMWSAHPVAFGPVYSDRRVRPGLPPSYPRR